MLKVYAIIHNEEYLENYLLQDIWKQNSNFTLIGGTSNLDEALSEIEKHHHDLFFIDKDMEPIDGINLIRLLRGGRPNIVYVLLTSTNSPDQNHFLRQAMQLGVFDVLSMPASSSELEVLLENIIENFYTETLYNTCNVYAFIKNSNRMRELFHKYYEGLLALDVSAESSNLLIRTSYHGTLQLMYTKLPYLKHFIDVHRSYTFETLQRQYPFSDDATLYTAKIISFFDFVLLLHPDTENEQMNELYNYVLDNIDHGVTLSTTASFLYSSPSSISRLFLENSGQHFNQYLTKVKMLRAEYLLLNSDLYVYEISAMLGYRDKEYFSSIFRRHYGISPNQFRTNY